jgi:hypothetical protein
VSKISCKEIRDFWENDFLAILATSQI